MKVSELRKMIREEIRRAVVKKNLNEGYAWERQPGKPLPTIKDVQMAYNKSKIPEANATPMDRLLRDLDLLIRDIKPSASPMGIKKALQNIRKSYINK